MKGSSRELWKYRIGELMLYLGLRRHQCGATTVQWCKEDVCLYMEDMWI